jgi:hypothetical protein
MAFVVKLTSPAGDQSFGSAPKAEGLRYRVYKREDAEQFKTVGEASESIVLFRQMRELTNYAYEVIEV